MARQETGISKARARELLESARMDVARVSAMAMDVQTEVARIIGITGELWHGLDLGDDVPEFEVQVRVRNVS